MKKFKSCIIEIDDNPALSEAVQRMLFGMGYEWNSGDTQIRYTNTSHICVGVFHQGKLTTNDFTLRATSFNAATQFGELVAFLAGPEKPKPKIHIASPEVSGIIVYQDGSGVCIKLREDFTFGHLILSTAELQEMTEASLAARKKNL